MPLKQFYTFICRELIFPVIASDKMYLLCFLKGRNFPFAAVSFHCQVGTGMDEMMHPNSTQKKPIAAWATSLENNGFGIVLLSESLE